MSHGYSPLHMILVAVQKTSNALYSWRFCLSSLNVTMASYDTLNRVVPPTRMDVSTLQVSMPCLSDVGICPGSVGLQYGCVLPSDGWYLSYGHVMHLGTQCLPVSMWMPVPTVPFHMDGKVMLKFDLCGSVSITVPLLTISELLDSSVRLAIRVEVTNASVSVTSNAQIPVFLVIQSQFG